MSKVSVIVPYHKGPSYLEECVKSIENQGLSDLEILIVDDRGGHDVPESVLKAEHVRHIVLEEEFGAKGRQEIPVRPFGVAVARNTGVRYASGDYLYFLDADDYLWGDALARLVKLADEKKAKVVTGNRYSTWFRPISFTFDKAGADTKIDGIVPLQGNTLKNVLNRRFTVQHLLIQKEYYDSMKFEFDVYNTFYSDVPVVARMFAGAAGDMWADGGSIYVWRRRNDPVHMPALCQQKGKWRSGEFIEAYEAACKCLEEDGGPQKAYLLGALNWWLCWFTLRKFPRQIKGKRAVRYTKNLQKIKDEEFGQMNKRFRFLQRIELKCIRRGNYRMAALAGKLVHIWRKKCGIFGKPIQYWRFLDKLVFQKMRIREDWVFVESFFGKSYSDSPKYLYEYLYDKYGDQYRFIWCLNRRTREVKGRPSICRRHSLRYVYYTARAKYFICNTRQPAWFKKRKETVFVETWHGTPLKKLAFDLEDIHAVSQDHKKLFYSQSKEWDYLVSANRFSTDVFERAFCFPREKIIETGYPRNDILYSEHAGRIAEEVKRELGIPKGKRVILYAPTWRDNQFYEKAKYKFTLVLDLERMRREFGNDSVLLLRTHYYIADRLELSGLDDFVYNGSGYGDVSRLYLVSDICITDYSSVFFFFSNLKRPLLFFAYDLEDYKEEIRGMYLDMEKELPGPVVQTNDELIDALRHLDEVTEQYRERYERFYDKFCHIDDGNAAERVVQAVFGGR